MTAQPSCELPYRQSTQKRRLPQPSGINKDAGLLGIPGVERLQIVVHGSLHMLLHMARTRPHPRRPRIGQAGCPLARRTSGSDGDLPGGLGPGEWLSDSRQACGSIAPAWAGKSLLADGIVLLFSLTSNAKYPCHCGRVGCLFWRSDLRRSERCSPRHARFSAPAWTGLGQRAAASPRTAMR